MLNIEPHRRAAYPALAIETHEDARFCESLLTQYPEREIFSVAAAGGLKDLRSGKCLNETAKYGDALKHTCTKDGALLVVLDFQHVAQNAPAYRQLIDALPALKRRGSMALLLAPAWSLPAELQHQLPVLRDSLPTAEELSSTLDVVLDGMAEASEKAQATAKAVTPEQRNALLQSARGLTRDEAENAFALAAADGLQPHAVESEKLRLVKSRCMSVERPGDPAQLGGMGGFKRWIASDVLPAKDDAELRARGTRPRVALRRNARFAPRAGGLERRRRARNVGNRFSA